MAISYFTVNAQFASVETNQDVTGGNVPVINEPSGTVIFTPNYSEIASDTLNEIVFINPIAGRFNSGSQTATYVVQTGDTWDSIAAALGGAGMTVANLQAANPTETDPPTVGNTIAIPAEPDGALRTMNGVLGVQLVDNVNLGLDPGKLTYRVDFSNVVFNSIKNQPVKSFRIAAPGDGSAIDLNDQSKWLPV